MSTTTTNYGFTLPAVADPIDEDLWGTELNSNFSSLDDILPTPSANKYGAIAVQNSTDNGLDYITSQGASGTILVSNGADALPSFQTLAAAILPYVYPVGSYYINETVSTNPATLLGFGTWTAVTDRFVIGASGTYAAGSTGGATTHTLTAGEIPALTYTLSSTTSGAPPGTSTRPGPIGSTTTASDASSTGCITTNAGGGAHSILNPYIAAYIWKRTV